MAHTLLGETLREFRQVGKELTDVIEEEKRK